MKKFDKEYVEFELGKMSINEPKAMTFTLFLGDETKLRGLKDGKPTWQIDYQQAAAYCIPILKLSHFDLIFAEEGRYLVDWNEGIKLFLSKKNIEKLADDPNKARIEKTNLTNEEMDVYWENK